MSSPMMTVDDEKLVQLFKALDPKRRKTAIKGALRRAANLVWKQAQQNLRASGLNDKTGVSKGIRRLVYKEKLGFRITVGTRKRGKGKNAYTYGYHTNSRGKEKPVALWAEGGTKGRYTKTQTKVFRRKRRGHFTGVMPRYGFMERTKQEMSPQVDSMLKQEINLNIQRIAKKYGCTIT